MTNWHGSGVPARSKNVIAAIDRSLSPLFSTHTFSGEFSVAKYKISPQIRGLHHARTTSPPDRARPDGGSSSLSSVTTNSRSASNTDKVRVVARSNASLVRSATSQASRALRHPMCQIEQCESSFARLRPHQRQSHRQTGNPAPCSPEIALGQAASSREDKANGR